MDNDHGNGDTIRSIAVKLMESKFKDENANEKTSRAIFILGNKQSGKTTLVNLFLEKNDSQSDTLGLEYTYGRKNVQGHLNEKNVCHVWELGGDMFRTPDILKTPLQAHKRCPISIVIFLDLSQPKCIWAVLEKCLISLQTVIEKLNIVNINNKQNITENPNKYVKESIGLFPLPLYIVGGKYDLFSEFDINLRKVICKALRSVAILTGANLIFYSKNDQIVRKRIKDCFNHIGFGTELKSKANIIDVNKPLFILTDSWESIGISPTSWDSIKTMYTTQFPQVEINMKVPDDPSLEANYREPLIDSLRNQKDDELKLMLEETARHNF